MRAGAQIGILSNCISLVDHAQIFRGSRRLRGWAASRSKGDGDDRLISQAKSRVLRAPVGGLENLRARLPSTQIRQIQMREVLWITAPVSPCVLCCTVILPAQCALP